MTRLQLAQIRRRFVIGARPLDVETEAALRADPRPGAQAILDAVARRRAENRSEGQRLRKLLQFEGALWTAGVMRVAGVDEAGMSPLAGPVAAAAVVFAPGSRIPGVDDSKKLDAETRNRLAVEIKQRAVAWSVAFAEVEEIDRINIYWAGLLAMRRAVEGLFRCPTAHPHRRAPSQRARDAPAGHCEWRRQKPDHRRRLDPGQDGPRRLHARLDEQYPGYGFSKHKGYPVREHVAALARLGACPFIAGRSRPSARSSACRRSRHGRMRRPLRRALEGLARPTE